MKKNDKHIALQDLREAVENFSKVRDWHKFHTPKEMAIAVSIEVGELLELFLWKKDKEISKLLTKKKFRTQVEDEFADIIHACLAFANYADIDITTAFLKKLEKTAANYPISKSKGKNKKYTEL